VWRHRSGLGRHVSAQRESGLAWTWSAGHPVSTATIRARMLGTCCMSCTPGWPRTKSSKTRQLAVLNVDEEETWRVRGELAPGSPAATLPWINATAARVESPRPNGTSISGVGGFLAGADCPGRGVRKRCPGGVRPRACQASRRYRPDGTVPVYPARRAQNHSAKYRSFAVDMVRPIQGRNDQAGLAVTKQSRWACAFPGSARRGTTRCRGCRAARPSGQSEKASAVSNP